MAVVGTQKNRGPPMDDFACKDYRLALSSHVGQLTATQITTGAQWVGRFANR
jgi:hypothetical protein